MVTRQTLYTVLHGYFIRLVIGACIILFAPSYRYCAWRIDTKRLQPYKNMTVTQTGSLW